MKHNGFTLIEVVAFLVISSILMSTIMLSATNALRISPQVEYQGQAISLAKSCMEYLLGQRRLNGYSNITIGTLSTANCLNQTGYTITATATSATFNGDNTYRDINVSVSGLSTATQVALVGNF